MRHAKDRCSGGRTKINCPNNRIEVPSSAYEKAFYPEARCSFIATKWLEWEAKQRGIHIHYARCGHGGERHILGARVDGYHPETKTVFQYHGCFWHGCKQCYPKARSGTVAQLNKQGEFVVRGDSQGQPMKRKDAYDLTLMRAKFLRDSGYTVVEKWETRKARPLGNRQLSREANDNVPPTQSSTTSKHTKTRARRNDPPPTSFTRASTCPSPYPLRTR